ncbi:MAG: D-aminoacyl-tRNA deacylase [Pseudomonadaceae bacterium]|nr:D-aminoacyl-tRNA deacylase [Pseudomonadaceae bacterium]
MKALLQRVSSATVEVGGKQIAGIQSGLLVFLGVAAGDTQEQVNWLTDKVTGLRIFPGQSTGVAKPMDRSVVDVGGEILVVSQFTLAADTSRGRRPGFSTAAAPELAEPLYEAFVAELKKSVPVQVGQFGADMQVALVNDGPVTFLLER